jgi:23S rRNA pseudouridine1911/1915/1917 synthase
VPAELVGQALDAVVRALWDVSWGKARGWIETGKVWVGGECRRDSRAPVAAGVVIELRMNAPRMAAGGSAPAGDVVSGTGETAVSAVGRERLVHVDSQIVVVDKPPGISSVPFERGERGTLIDAVAGLVGQRKLEVVHRIDKETSGLIVFARTADAARGLANQFRFHTIHRRYLALAHGQVQAGTIRSLLIEDRGDGLRGTAPRGWRVARGEGQEAVTHVEVVERLRGGGGAGGERGPEATLVECRLETGRTHQIRIHLSEAGHPLLGERLYVRDYQGPRLVAPRVMLHAAVLGLRHPRTGAEMRWRSEVPGDFAGVLERLRGR